MRIEIQVKSGHFQWGKKEQGSVEIDIQALFKDYWNTTSHEYRVRGQLGSLASPFTADRKGAADIMAGKHCHSLELQFSAEVTVRVLTIVHHTLLTPFARRILFAPRSLNSKDC